MNQTPLTCLWRKIERRSRASVQRFNDVSPEQKYYFGAFARLRLAILRHWPRNFAGTSRRVATSPMQARKTPCPAGHYCTNHASRIRKYQNLAPSCVYARILFMTLLLTTVSPVTPQPEQLPPSSGGWLCEGASACLCAPRHSRLCIELICKRR